MHRIYFSVFLLFLIAVLQIHASPLYSQESSNESASVGPSEESQRYLKQLADAAKNVEKSIQQMRERGLGSVADQMEKSQLRRYQQELKMAEKSVADGNEFGRTEYQAVLKQILEAAKSDHQRTINEINQNSEIAMSESQRQYDQTISEAKKKHEDATSKSNESFRQRMDAIRLKEKFRSSPNRIGLVIWNLPSDSALHDRQTTAVTVQLNRGKQVVWTRRNVKLNRKQPNTVLRLPNVLFDSVSVELLKWSGEGGGLSEVQVFLGDENVAMQRPCEMSNIETLPIHLDDAHALTDGIDRPTKLGVGYWIPEADVKATATIQLLGKPVPPQLPRVR